MIRYVSLVLGTFIFCCMSFAQVGLTNIYPKKDFSIWTSSELILNNGIVQRIIKLPVDTGTFITTSYKPVIGTFHY